MSIFKIFSSWRKVVYPKNVTKYLKAKINLHGTPRKAYCSAPKSWSFLVLVLVFLVLTSSCSLPVYLSHTLTILLPCFFIPLSFIHFKLFMFFLVFFFLPIAIPLRTSIPSASLWSQCKCCVFWHSWVCVCSASGKTFSDNYVIISSPTY